MPRQRRDREKPQESKEQQVGRTPQNKAKAQAGTRRAKTANNKDSAVVSSTVVENDNNPLKKVVFIHHVLRFSKQGYLGSDSSSDVDSDSDCDVDSGVLRFLKQDYLDSGGKAYPIPRFIPLRQVSSSWKETIEFYNPHPQENALTFCRHFFILGYVKQLKSPSVLGSIVLRDIVGWLSNVEIANISDTLSFAYDMLWYIRRCLDSSAWKEEEKSGFEHHAAFVRDTLLWISKFCDFNNFDHYEDELGVWCNIIYDVIKMKEGEYFGFDTIEMRDALLAVSKTITTSNSADRYGIVIKWFELVFTLTQENEKMQKIFGTKEVLGEFIRLSKHKKLKLFEDERFDEKEMVEKEKYYSCFFKSLSAITELETNRNLFATVELRDAMVRIFNWAVAQCWRRDYHRESEYFSRLLHNLITSTNKSNKKLFAVESVRDILLRKGGEDELYEELYNMEHSTEKYYHSREYVAILQFRHHRWTRKIISTDEGACLFFENLLALFEVNPELFLIDETRKNLVEFARRIVIVEEIAKIKIEEEERKYFDVSPATIRIFLTVLHTMLHHHNEKLFFSVSIDSFLEEIKRTKKILQEEESTKLFSEIEEIYSKMKEHLEREKKEKGETKRKNREKKFEEEEKRYWELHQNPYCILQQQSPYWLWRSDGVGYSEPEKDLEDEYWEDGFVYYNCYYRECLEEGRSNKEKRETLTAER